MSSDAEKNVHFLWVAHLLDAQLSSYANLSTSVVKFWTRILASSAKKTNNFISWKTAVEADVRKLLNPRAT